MQKYCYEIYFGLNDMDNNRNNFSTEEIRKRLIHLSSIYKFPFSLSIVKGGYKYDCGDYVIEDCAHVTVVNNVLEENLTLLCNAIKKEFHQESILITRHLTNQTYM